MGLVLKVKSIFNDFRIISKYYSDVKSIARRMFVTNSFDGILAAIGVDVGGFSPTADPAMIAMSIVGGGVAMGVFSGVIGVYMSERAERMKELAELERKMAKSLKGTVYWKAVKIIPVYVALWSGIGILLFPTLTALPYVFAKVGLIGIKAAFLASLVLALASMAFLGLYLGFISGENPVRSAFRSLGVGLGGAALVWLLRSLLGFPIA